MTQDSYTVTFDWVHPSWRDVVIDHLMRHPSDRRRFLRRCSMVGLELALSVSGGARGQREQPLLRSPDDWLELRRRMLELLPEQDQGSHRLLLEAVQASLLTTEDEQLRNSVEMTAHELCSAVVDEWDRREEPLRVRTLESFYRLSELLTPLPRGPQLGRSVAAWLEHLNADRTDEVHEPLEGLAVVAENEPRALRRIKWPYEYSALIKTLVNEAQDALVDAQRVREDLSSTDLTDRDEVGYQSYRAFRWRRILEELERSGAENQDTARLAAELYAVEAELDNWSEQKDQEAEDIAAEIADDEYEDDDEGPNAFDISEVLSDL